MPDATDTDEFPGGGEEALQAGVPEPERSRQQVFTLAARSLCTNCYKYRRRNVVFCVHLLQDIAIACLAAKCLPE